MSEKITIILDTNFIVSNIPKFEEAINDLSKTYNVFISDISIQERLSQRYLELKEKHDKIKNFSSNHIDIIEVIIKKSFEDQWEHLKRGMQERYRKLFGSNIINFMSNADTLNNLMDRAFKKLPPFSTAEKSSDKGFKDTLIWLSIMEYFKFNGDNEVVFITDDKAFRNNSDILYKEFVEYTGKKIEIKENNFLEISNDKNNKDTTSLPKPLPDVKLLRDKIQEYISALCYGYYAESNFGDPVWVKTFTLRSKTTLDSMQIIFGNLRNVISNNLFESSISADIAFNIDTIENNFAIPIESLQKALSLYEEIFYNNKEYLFQFLNASANIFNRNYHEPESNNDFEVPF